MLLFLLGVVMLKFRSFLVLGLFGISISVASCGGNKANNNQSQKPATVPDRTVLPDDSRINTVIDQDTFVCAHDLNVRNSYLEIIPNAKTVYGEKVKKTGDKKSKWLNGSDVSFVRVKFLSDSAHGWLAEKYVKAGSCDGKSSSPSTTYNNTEADPTPTTTYKPSDSVLSLNVEPGLAAMMDAVAFAEFRGSSAATSFEAYKTIFTYAKFSSFSRHPAIVKCSGGLCSDAAGRYQFLSTAWGDVKRYVNSGRVDHIPQIKGRSLSDFSPANQDRGALVLFWYKYSYEPLKNLKYGDNWTLETVTRKLAKTWASLPWSPYGQGHVSWSSFKDYFWKRYQAYSN